MRRPPAKFTHSRFLPLRPFTAMVIGKTIIWREGEPVTRWVLAHELAHVTQYQRLGTLRFLLTYLAQAAAAGFRHGSIPLEKEADELASTGEYLAWAEAVMRQEGLL